MKFEKAVGKAIRECRHERGWTQSSLAVFAGLSVNYVARLERGECGPSLASAMAIADALGVPVDKLIVEARPSISKTDFLHRLIGVRSR